MNGGVRAQWHLAELSEDPDPFARAIYTTGLEIDLNGSEGELVETWLRLGRIEERIRRGGVVPTCGLKDGGQDCLTCTQSTLDPAEALSQLCRLGKDQATVERACNAKTAERRGSCEELADDITPAVELISATEELEDVLAAAGL